MSLIPKELLERDRLIQCLTDNEKDELLAYLAYVGFETTDPNYTAVVAVFVVHCLVRRSATDLSKLPDEIATQQQRVWAVSQELEGKVLSLQKLAEQLSRDAQKTAVAIKSAGFLDPGSPIVPTPVSPEKVDKQFASASFWVGLCAGVACSTVTALCLMFVLAAFSQLPESNSTKKETHDGNLAMVSTLRHDRSWNVCKHSSV